MLKWSNFSESLLVRSVYLITIPIVLVQIIGIIIFFELHWDLVLKRSAQSISNEIKRLLKDKSYLDKILDDGCKKADSIASIKIKKIRDIVGF